MDYRQKRNTKHLPLAQSINLPGQHLSPLLHNSSITLLTLFSTDPHPLLLIYILRPCVSHLKCLSHSSLGKSEKKKKKNKTPTNKRPIQVLFLTGSFFQSLHYCGPYNHSLSTVSSLMATLSFMLIEPGIVHMHNTDYYKDELAARIRELTHAIIGRMCS